MNTDSSSPNLRRKLLWPGFGALMLLVWTVYCHVTWLHRTGFIHGLLAFFLGVLVLILINALVRLVIGVFKCGWRWLGSREALRLCGWTVLFAVSTIALFYNVELWRGKRAWAAVVHEAKARSEPLNFESMDLPVPDAQNFARAPYFALLFAATNGVASDPRTLQFNFVAQWARVPFISAHTGERIRFAPWLEAEPTDLRSWLGFWRSWQTNNPISGIGRPITLPEVSASEAAAMLLESLDRSYGKDLDSLREFGDRAYCRFPLDYSRQMFDPALPAHVLGGFVRILRLRASAALVAEESEAALADLQFALRLADYNRQQPWVMQTEMRLRGVVDTLQPLWEGLVAHRWNEQQLAAVQAQLEALDVLSDFPLAVRNDALALSSLVERIIPTSAATPRRVPHMPPENEGLLALVRHAYPTGWSLQNQAAIHRFHLDTTSRYFDVNARRLVNEPRAEPRGLFASSDPFFPVFIVPKIKQLSEDAAEGFPFAHSAVDLATVACALERYRLANDEFPPTLAALVPQFAAKLPHDIITGEPLKYRRTEGGFVLYSVGFNEVDDGGVPCVRHKNWRGEPESRFDLNQNDWVWAYPASRTKP
ncbi:MAG: hypothetical protein IH623_05370 [Verrucomicrobia bacterium]|nr:hypothetical protein [Verrucomicrobiota bacterium]